MLNIYFSSKFENKLMVQSVVHHLQQYILFNNVSSWIYLNEPLSIEECSVIDFGDIDKCDVLIALFPFSIGANCEVGYAMGRNKKVIYLVERMLYNGEYKSKFMTKPLFAGVMFYPYEDNQFKLNKETYQLYNAYINHSFVDMVSTLKMMEK